MISIDTAAKRRLEPQSFIDTLLAQERAGTAVDQFSNWHQRRSEPASPPDRSYQRLIPLTQPIAGQQYAFEVDLDRCSGCKACVAACHSLNGLEETETWRSVGLLVGPPAIQRHVTTACHHCVDPGCLNGCPVLAYDKDPLTGVVRHLDDQCIGCQYCIMKCPYEVPRYTTRLGIVRKCDLCHHRLAVGEAPACAQACPTEAIRITIIDQTALATSFQNRSSFLPDSPDPSLTLPTTRFVSRSTLSPDLRAADHDALRLQEPHWPLIFMLLLSQASTGLCLAASFLARPLTRSFLMVAFGLLVCGLLAAGLHLGQPLKAWRGFLGWRRSWLSRELIALSGFVLIAGLTLLVGPARGSAIIPALAGLLAVFTSAMVYIDTGRPAWSRRFSFINFFGATLLLGMVLAGVLVAILSELRWVAPLLGASLGVRLFLFIWRSLEQHAAFHNRHNPVHLNARISRELRPNAGRLDALLLLAFGISCLLAFGNAWHLQSAWISSVAVAAFGSELIDRYLFFVASASKRMPGSFLS